jgi:predicted RNA-binding Zn-ribbon protein involved in translation (DUF1610 family)
MDCPECAKNGKVVAMRKDRGRRPAGSEFAGEYAAVFSEARIERAYAAVFSEDDMWVCPNCGHTEVAKD